MKMIRPDWSNICSMSGFQSQVIGKKVFNQTLRLHQSDYSFKLSYIYNDYEFLIWLRDFTVNWEDSLTATVCNWKFVCHSWVKGDWVLTKYSCLVF